jgi:hypothetical protein
MRVVYFINFELPNTAGAQIKQSRPAGCGLYDEEHPHTHANDVQVRQVIQSKSN